MNQQGYQCLCLECDQIGQGQTRYAQGIIHGGTKYALTGKLTASSEAIRAMPERWQACLKGQGEIDLSAVKVLSDHQYLWSTASLGSRLSGFFASKVMKSRTQALDRTERPAIFQHEKFAGQVYQLDEVVLDTASVLQALAQPCTSRIVHYESASLQIDNTESGYAVCYVSAGKTYSWHTGTLVLCAGAGNEMLLQQLNCDVPRMQRRPLHMVAVRGMPEPLYAHCLGASSVPRMTITSHPDSDGRWVWYLGGQLAEEGVARSEAEQVRLARAELQNLLPWIALEQTQWASLRIDRAEPQQANGQRPATAFVEQQGHLLTCWPTKLAFAPLLVDEVLQRITHNGPPSAPALAMTDVGEFPGYASLPWLEQDRWV